ncbi:MAG: glycosyltransferase family 39 protein [Lachnospiraceae bacterium]|nr:glycosyltransferase family 39 protein [Lachnospiraceae bacterium]
MLKFCSRFLKFTLIIIFSFLTVSSLLVTQSCFSPDADELSNVPVYKLHDNILLHLAAILIFCVIIYLLRALTDKKAFVKGLLAKSRPFYRIAAAVLAFLISYLILSDGSRTPYGDQAQVYGAAMYFNTGNYINLSPGGYLDMYPHQLGYVAFLQLLFKITGSTSFFMVQVINCLFIAGIVFAACLLIESLTDSTVVQLLGTLYVLTLLPLYIHASLLYGDIPSMLFSLLFINHFIKGLRSRQPKYLLLSVPELVLAVLFKKNSIILLIAAAIILMIHIIITRRRLLIILLLALCITPFGSLRLINTYYSNISGYTVTGGIPSSAWIAMGMLEEGSPGWFNNYPVPAYYEAEYDRRKASEMAIEKIKERFNYFREDPIYALSFWKRKISTQWNDPFFHSYDIIFTDEEETHGLTAFIIEHSGEIMTALSIFQNITYSGVLLYLIFRRSTDSNTVMSASYDTDKNIREHGLYMLLPELCILGGFLFSILWEANSRFILPYYIIMLPLACIGWNNLISKIRASLVVS